jgi:RND superfamily putative drug exporter
MFERLGTIVSRHWAFVLLFWAVLVAGVWYVAPRWEDVSHDGDFAYLPDEMTSVQGQKLLDEAFPDVLSKSQVVLVVSREGGPLQEEDVKVADRLVKEFAPRVRQAGPIVGILSPRTEVLGKSLVSPFDPDDSEGPDGQALLIILQLRNEFMAVDNMRLLAGIYETVGKIRADEHFPKGLQLGVSGSAAIGYDILDSARESIRNTEWTTILLVILILVLVYRSPGLVMIPLVTILASVTVALGVVALAAQWSGRLDWLDFKIFRTTKIFVVVILFGAGTDYCLFLISRYREELERGRSPGEAIAEALARVGDALAASALTTILGLATMAFAAFGKFRNSGPAIALCLVVALLASMSLAPALLRAGGRRVFWPLGARGPKAAPREGGAGERGREAGLRLFQPFWTGVARHVIARPGLILLVSLLLLSPLAYEGLRFDVTYDLLSELRSDRPSVRGTRLLRRYFNAGETGPVIVLAYNEDGRFDTKEALWTKIQPLADELAGLEYPERSGTRPVATVRCLTEPLGETRKTGLFGTIQDTMVRRHSRTQNTYLAQAPDYVGKVTRFDLVFRYDPFSAKSIRALNYVEAHLDALAQDPASGWFGTKFYFTGTTAGIRDLEAVLEGTGTLPGLPAYGLVRRVMRALGDQRLIQILVVAAVLVVLLVILRRPAICAYMVLSVLLGYFVTMGVAERLFSLLYGDTFHGLDWKVPIFLFVILIAVGQDYNVYLATRVFEEQKRRGPTEGLRVALVRTGGIITSCGVIMAGTFASMTSGTLRTMHELGFALAFGVLLDTFVIRTILLPAFLVIRDRHFPPARAAEQGSAQK